MRELLAPLAAVWIDRFPRRLVMLTNDVASGVLVLGLLMFMPVAVLGPIAERLSMR